MLLIASESTPRISDGGHAQSLTVVELFAVDLLSRGSAPQGCCGSHQGVRVSPAEQPTLNRRQTPSKMAISLLARMLLASFF